MNNSPVVLGHPSPETPYQKGFKSGKDYWRDQKNPFPENDWQYTRWQEGHADGLKERPQQKSPTAIPIGIVNYGQNYSLF